MTLLKKIALTWLDSKAGRRVNENYHGKKKPSAVSYSMNEKEAERLTVRLEPTIHSQLHLKTVVVNTSSQTLKYGSL